MKEIEAICTALGVTAQEHSMRSRPDARHWHLRKPGEAGTMEVTFEAGKWIVEVRSNRRGSWTGEAVEKAKISLAGPTT